MFPLLLLVSILQAQQTSGGDTPALNAQYFRPSLDSQGLFWLDDAQLGKDRALFGRFLLQWANEPLVYETAQGEQIKLVDDLFQLDLMGGTVFGPLRVGVDLPIYLRSTGEAAGGETGLGDIALDVKGRILDGSEAPLGLAIGTRLGLPTATVDASLGADGFVWDLGVKLDKAMGDTLLVANLGTRAQPRVELENAVLNEQLVYGLGAFHRLSDAAGVGLELVGHASFGELGNAAANPLEAILGGWMRPGGGDLVLRGGLGLPLSRGIGAPQNRVLLEEQYSPSLVVGHPVDGGAPVVFEPHPTYDNLFGRIEYNTDQGALYTSYRQLRPGALHRANGGFLMLEAEKLLSEPFVWEALKRALQSRKLKMESPLAELGRLATVTLTPQVIPLNVKVIIIGSRQLYYTLQDLDPDFQEMFRVLVDFDEDIPLAEDSLEQFAQLMKTRTSEEGMAPLTAAAVARLATYSARLAEHQGRLSARIGDLFQLVSEADFIRQLAKDEVTDVGHIERALKAKATRTGRVSARILEDILAGVILIDSEGAAIGKCNGLTVLEVGDSAFGMPARISATVYPGGSGIVDIEREVNLGQPIHSKGVMILTGYLGSRYAQEFPLEISASIALEQSYGYVDGDSASLGECCALISALSRTPLKQCFAITGSINQFGEVQAVGGVNEKIEGFFRLCEARGLTGEQGVIIPFANVTTLMLDERVLEAVRQQRFHVYAVRQVDEALSLLVGEDVGAANEQGHFPKGSVNARVVERLRDIAEIEMEDEGKSESATADQAPSTPEGGD